MKYIFLCLVTWFCNNTFVYAESKLATIGISVWSGYPDNVAGFKEKLLEEGLEENINVKYLYRNANANKKTQRAIAEEFRDKKVDLVYSLTTPGTIIIKEVLPKTTPIIFSIVTYPADSGLIESLEYSGNNLVGTSNYVPLSNYIQLLTTVMPAVKKVAIFHRKGEPNSKIQSAGLSRLLGKKGINVIDKAPSSLDEVKEMASNIAQDIDAFITTTDTLMQSGGEDILIEISQQFKKPILSSNKQGIVNGSTFGPVVDFKTLGMISGGMAAQVMKNNLSPASLKSQYQNPPTILINKRSLENMNITIPSSLPNFKYAE